MASISKSWKRFLRFKLISCLRDNLIEVHFFIHFPNVQHLIHKQKCPCRKVACKSHSCFLNGQNVCLTINQPTKSTLIRTCYSNEAQILKRTFPDGIFPKTNLLTDMMIPTATEYITALKANCNTHQQQRNVLMSMDTVFLQSLYCLNFSLKRKMVPVH